MLSFRHFSIAADVAKNIHIPAPFAVEPGRKRQLMILIISHTASHCTNALAVSNFSHRSTGRLHQSTRSLSSGLPVQVFLFAIHLHQLVSEDAPLRTYVRTSVCILKKFTTQTVHPENKNKTRICGPYSSGRSLARKESFCARFCFLKRATKKWRVLNTQSMPIAADGANRSSMKTARPAGIIEITHRGNLSTANGSQPVRGSKSSVVLTLFLQQPPPANMLLA